MIYGGQLSIVTKPGRPLMRTQKKAARLLRAVPSGDRRSAEAQLKLN
jgi:hypothetical protein